MNQKLLKIFGVMILMATPELLARNLTNVELYRRCYAQLTQESPKYNDMRLIQVRSGQLQPIAACMEVFDEARFSISNPNALEKRNSPLAAQVLNTMHGVHQTFFLNRNFVSQVGSDEFNGMVSIYDPSEPALFYTRALFTPVNTNNTPVTRFDSIIKSQDHLRALRRDISNFIPKEQRLPANVVADSFGNDPLKSVFNFTQQDTFFKNANNFKFAARGSLYGVASTGNMEVTVGTGGVNLGTVKIGASRGGGIIGTPTYLLLTVNEFNNFAADSGTMPRRWAKAVFNDILCRDLPAIRFEDANKPGFISASADAHPFRKSQSCVQCHASMDRMASVIRNFKYTSYGTATPLTFGGIFATTYPTNNSLDGTQWPASPIVIDKTKQNNYYNRPTLGVLYYRDYEGKLVNQNISSVQDLGNKIALQTDFYICAAKHYYQYFTGVDVDVFDPSDDRYRNRGTDMMTHKNNVITLGKNLQTHQNLRTLINAILNLGIYKKSDFGVNGI